MPLPEDPDARQQIARDLAGLWKLPPDQRREVLEQAKQLHQQREQRDARRESLMVQYEERFPESVMPPMLGKAISNMLMWEWADTHLEAALKANVPIRDWGDFDRQMQAAWAQLQDRD